MDFGEEMNVLADDFPKKEIYNLSYQLRRASDSIALNISEGSIGQFEKEFKKFMGYAIRSLAEVINCLHKASRRNYISTLKFGQYYKDSFDLMNMMIAFKQKIKLRITVNFPLLSSHFQPISFCQL